MRQKYPAIECNQSGYLQVGAHEIYWEESGNPKGVPVIFLHGGPGSGTNPSHRCFFDPKIYRIVLMDQRGCGKSRPHACLEDNTSWDLVEDIERLKQQLGVEKWVVFGGSWGSTLALLYAEEHPESVLALILRGIFLARKEDIHWFYQFGAHHIFPDQFEKYLEPIEKSEREDLVSAYYRRLTSEDPATRRRAALSWAAWEGAALKLHFDEKLFDQFVEDKHADALSRIECHYFKHGCFFKSDNQLIERADRLKDIPGVIIHGRYDIVCPVKNAWDLHKVYKEAELKIIPDAGHAVSEPGILDALLEATDLFGHRFLPSGS